jgi:glycine cleavage system H protein
MGITPTMVEILSEPYNISLLRVGETLYQGSSFGTIEGYKMTSDLISPVSGTIIQFNDFMASLVQTGLIRPINDDPFNSGWMIVVQISKPDELKSLLSPQKYKELVSK